VRFQRGIGERGCGPNKEHRIKNKEIAHHNLFSVLCSLFWLLGGVSEGEGTRDG
jgi:hypothetical protein